MPPLKTGTVTVAFQNPTELGTTGAEVFIWTAVERLEPTQKVTACPTYEKFPAIWSLPKTWALTVAMSLTVTEPTVPMEPVSLP